MQPLSLIVYLKPLSPPLRFQSSRTLESQHRMDWQNAPSNHLKTNAGHSLLLSKQD